MGHKPSEPRLSPAEAAAEAVSAPTRPIVPTPEGEVHDHLAKREAEVEDRQEALPDEALEETFPGSDPISPKRITWSGSAP
jgi:hypothetical protein